MSIKITFLGTDGSGKSTVIKNLRDYLENRGNSVETRVMGWKDFQNPLVKIISRIHLRRKEKKGIEEDKIGRFRARSWFFYFIYYLELLGRYRKTDERKDYILFDRYFYDELAFASKTKFNFFRKITPKPELCFLLQASEKTMKKRGYNNDMKKVKYFYSHLENMKRECKMVKIDSSKPIKKTIDRVLKEISII